MTAMEAWNNATRHMNDLRSLQRLITCPAFEEVFLIHTTLVNDLLNQASFHKDPMLRASAFESLRSLIRRMENNESVLLLRNEARSLGIPNYTRMDKATLMAKLKEIKSNGSYKIDLGANRQGTTISA